MSGGDLVILPPAGVLAWLVPSLGTVLTSGTDEPGAWSLDRRPLRGEALVDAVLESGAARVRIPAGPRGDALAAFLRERSCARGGGPEIVVSDDLAPASIEHALETFLNDTRAAGIVHADAGGTWPESESWQRVSGGDRRKSRAGFLLLAGGPYLSEQVRSWIDVVRHRREHEPWTSDGGTWIPWVHSQAGPWEYAPDPLTRVAPTLRWLLPGPDATADGREALHELWRLLRPHDYPRFRVLEQLALAGVDPYRQSLEGRNRRLAAASPPARARRPLLVAIEGTDGSGKSHHVKALAEFLRARGLRTEVAKIYRHGVFHDTATDLCRSAGEGRNLHVWRLERLAKAFDSVKHYHANLAPIFEQADVVVLDRWVYTHFAAGPARIADDSWARELLASLPAPDLAYLLDVPTETALARIGERAEKTIDENPYMLARYRERFLALAERHGLAVLDARAPAEDNQQRIRDDVLAKLEHRGGRR